MRARLKKVTKERKLSTTGHYFIKHEIPTATIIRNVLKTESRGE